LCPFFRLDPPPSRQQGDKSGDSAFGVRTGGCPKAVKRPVFLVAYIRASSIGQNTARQLDGMTFDQTFTEKCSSSDTNRPQLKAMLAHVRKGDSVVFHEISRLARNTADLLALVEQLTNKGVTITFKKEGLTFTGEKANAMN
jgi:DNA invertase Pin-like site-specific DNA recombinase